MLNGVLKTFQTRSFDFYTYKKRKNKDLYFRSFIQGGERRKRDKLLILSLFIMQTKEILN